MRVFKKENPTLDKLIRLAQALQVDIGKIFTFVKCEDPRRRKVLLVRIIEKG